MLNFKVIILFVTFLWTIKVSFGTENDKAFAKKKMLNAAIRLEKFFRMLQKLCKMFILIIFSKIFLKIIYIKILHNFCSILKNISSRIAAFSIFFKQRLCQSLFRKKLLMFIKKLQIIWKLYILQVAYIYHCDQDSTMM